MTFSHFDGDELGLAFEIFKNHLRPIVEDTFGWDEVFQQQRFQSRLQPEWFSWILLDDLKVGLVCSRAKQDSVHLHLLIIFAERQRQGLGVLVTQMLQADAHSKNLSLTLSCFKNNHPALRLYQKLGFQVQSEDEHFYDFISNIEMANEVR